MYIYIQCGYWQPIPAAHCNALQHTAAHRNTLQHIYLYVYREDIGSRFQLHTATHGNILQHAATRCNALQQHAVTHCNTLQHMYMYIYTGRILVTDSCCTLQHTEPHCNTLQHTATNICIYIQGGYW